MSQTYILLGRDTGQPSLPDDNLIPSNVGIGQTFTATYTTAIEKELIGAGLIARYPQPLPVYSDGTNLPTNVAKGVSAGYMPGVVIADRTWTNSYDGVLGGSFKSNGACVYKARYNCTDLRPVYSWVNCESLTSMVNVTITAAVEYPIGATRQPFYFNGVQGVTLVPGAVAIADPIGVEIPQGAEFRIWTFFSPATSGLIRGPGAVLTGVTNADAIDLGSGSTDKTVSGTITNSTGGMPAPNVILGQPRDSSYNRLARIPQPLIVGDSIAEYGMDDRTLRRNPGWVNRWMDANGIAHINMAKSGENSSAWSSLAGCRYRKLMMQLATAVLYAEGTNDIHTTSAATIEANMLACATMAQARCLPFYVCTVLPLLPTTTDNYATVAGQTANATNEANRVPYNTWIRAGCPIDPSSKAAVAVGTSGALLAGQAGHPVTGYIEIANLVESAQDSGKWGAAAAVGTANLSGTSISALTTSSGTWANGQFIQASAGGGQIPALTTISGLAGSVGAQTATASYAMTTASGLAVASPLTADGTHPSQTGISAIVAGVQIPAGLIS